MAEILDASWRIAFALAGAFAVWVALDLGRRWIAERSRVRITNERLDAVEQHQREEMHTFEVALDQSLKGIQDFEGRLRDLEQAKEAEEMAGGFGRRPRPKIPLMSQEG